MTAPTTAPVTAPVVYYGVCYDSGAWGGDLTGLLIANGEVQGAHISSNAGWSERDISFKYERQRNPQDTFEWLGQMEYAAIRDRFGWTEAD